ncbi:MAG: hypothetical protein R3234_06030, partial [Thermoanaerobaculia bacterium]|nr:hypothetical protein [Thermoanaerobaculia bacterium]
TVIPSGRLALGIPARVSRSLSDEERGEISAIVERYARLKEEYRTTLAEEGDSGGGTTGTTGSTGATRESP